MKKIVSVMLITIMMLTVFASAAELDYESIRKSIFKSFSGLAQGVIDESTADDEAGAGSEAEDESEWENILLMGCDARSDSKRTRTDAMVILSINSAESRVKLTSLMRDTWMEVSGKEGHHKLTEFNVWGGPEMTIRAINENFGTNLDKYVLVNMRGLSKIIDILGGVDIEITESERKYINRWISGDKFYANQRDLIEKSGFVHLNGAQALTYARIRYLDSDYVRTERQRDVLLAMAKDILGDFDMKNVVELIGSFDELVETNLSMADMIRLASAAMQIDLEKLEQYRVPVDGTFKSGMFGNTWCIKPDFEENAKLLREFIYGE